ncbi:hypothetical protein [Flavobacterium sp. K5-23]|uniref:hypothetical protein n=1 Tax=Flavobacterium sp. K5-23 TaxID=2746225 RepID=UPI0020106D63|nr:hypothetical protein [Flavobacterium sp. K5-23]UQD55160.1 hypothetical protein FLAK523_01655 [Flavobacterium sp. K5-23]
MKKIHILLIVLLGLFLMPSEAFACGKISEKKSCTKEMASKTEKKDCCSNETHSKDKNQKGCNGKCGHSLCGSISIVNIGIFHSLDSVSQNGLFNFSLEKHRFNHPVSFTSEGYSSIWLIPKIG